MASVHFVCLSGDKGGALPNKDGNLSVGSDFVSFLQDVFEERDNDCCNMEDLQLSMEDTENRAEWRRRTRVADLRDPQPEGERGRDSD